MRVLQRHPRTRVDLLRLAEHEGLLLAGRHRRLEPLQARGVRRRRIGNADLLRARGVSIVSLLPSVLSAPASANCSGANWPSAPALRLRNGEVARVEDELRGGGVEPVEACRSRCRRAFSCRSPPPGPAPGRSCAPCPAARMSVRRSRRRPARGLGWCGGGRRRSGGPAGASCACRRRGPAWWRGPGGHGQHGIRAAHGQGILRNRVWGRKGAECKRGRAGRSRAVGP